MCKNLHNKEYNQTNDVILKLKRQTIYKDKNRKASKRWEDKNKDRKSHYNKEYNTKNREHKENQTKKWRLDNKDRHRKVLNLYRKKWLMDPTNRIAQSCRIRIHQTLNPRVDRPSASLINLLGCSVLEARRHIESQFLEGMSWENYGRKKTDWQIDHIRPCASFDLTDPEQQKVCFHYTNLRPLWAPDNWKKNKYLDLTSIA
jgi:hypothetical protein